MAEPTLLDQIKRIYIHRDSLESEVANNAIAFFPKDRIEIVDEKPLKNPEGDLTPKQFEQSKKLIYIAPFKGQFFKRCPGAKPGLVCCNYFVLNLGLQCNMNCSYCYLQSYLNTPIMTVYSNIEAALDQITQIAKKHPNQHYRLGTGETIDSLSLDEFTLYSKKLISFFKDLPNWTLELKTKSSKVDQFLDAEHAGNILCSWSLNPQNIVDSEEHETASLVDRLNAAEKCLKAGHKISFHLDPMIWHPNWKNSYKELFEQIVTRFTPNQLVHISVGALRFQPDQRHMMRDRFGMDSFVTAAEMHKCKDGKLRYDQALRNEMFVYIKQLFKNHNPLWRLSYCMEIPETWSTTMATSPAKVPELKELFVPARL